MAVSTSLPFHSSGTETQPQHHLLLIFSPPPHICQLADIFIGFSLSTPLADCLLISVSSSSHFPLLCGLKRCGKASSLWCPFIFPSSLLFASLCWPFDRYVIRLQLLLRYQVRGAAHEVVTPERLGEGNDVTDARSPDHDGDQPVQA